MEPTNISDNQTNLASLSKTSAKDFFLNLGAVISLYTVIGSLISLLFTVIQSKFPQSSTYGYDYAYTSMYMGAQSISWPVAMLIIVFPIFLTLMYLLGKEYSTPGQEKKHTSIHKWLTYITLFIAGITIAGDLISVIYYFIDGQEMTTGFVLKVTVVLVIAIGVFWYFISEIRNKLSQKERMVWRILACIIVIGSIAIGFFVLGSPRTQRLYKYDTEKINELSSLTYSIENYYSIHAKLPSDLSLLAVSGYPRIVDMQTSKPYGYEILSATTYNLCADFNKNTPEYITNSTYGNYPWVHPAGTYCFTQVIKPGNFPTVPQGKVI
jgi:hypothetical protein